MSHSVFIRPHQTVYMFIYPPPLDAVMLAQGPLAYEA
jgi:hypothetical protein